MGGPALALGIEAIGGSHSAVPKSGIFYRALLVAKVGVDQSIALGETLCPLEIIHQGPGMEGADPRSIGDGAGQFGEHFAVPLNPAPVRYAAMLIGSIEITAAALGDFDDGMVVLLRNLGDQVVHAAR